MTNLQALWEYQEAYLKLYNLKKTLAGSEAHVKYRKLHSRLLDLQGKKEALQKLIAENGAELAKFEEEISKLEGRLEIELAEIATMQNDPECTSDEAAESTKAFEELLNDVKRLKARIMRILDTLTKAQAKLQEVLSRGARAKKEYDALKIVCAEEEAAQKENMALLKTDIDLKAASVKDKALLRRFASIQKLHLDPIATVEDDKCSGCKMALPTSLAYKVVSGHELIECESCGRLLCNKEDLIL